VPFLRHSVDNELMTVCSKLKKITAFCAAKDGTNIFVGTDSGNIHQVDVSTFRLSNIVICRESITQQYVAIYPVYHSCYIHTVHMYIYKTCTVIKQRPESEVLAIARWQRDSTG